VRREIPDTAPLVIAGDFNDWQRRVDALLREELGLAEVAAAQQRKPLIERFAPVREAPRVARTFPAFLPWLSLDRIYLRGFTVAQASVPRGLAWARRSDHAPLIADVSAS
jgi:endonuclease/exonuclease/phosphatase family metal-dependent hydrolase